MSGGAGSERLTFVTWARVLGCSEGWHTKFSDAVQLRVCLEQGLCYVNLCSPWGSQNTLWAVWLWESLRGWSARPRASGSEGNARSRSVLGPTLRGQRAHLRGQGSTGFKGPNAFTVNASLLHSPQYRGNIFGLIIQKIQRSPTTVVTVALSAWPRHTYFSSDH